MFEQDKQYLETLSPVTLVEIPQHVRDLNTLIEAIEDGRFEFDMSTMSVAQHCGTAGCIAGTAAGLWEDCRARNMYSARGVQERFHWTPNQYMSICRPLFKGLQFVDIQREIYTYHSITRAGAVATLRRFRDTGIIEWRRAEQI